MATSAKANQLSESLGEQCCWYQSLQYYLLLSWMHDTLMKSTVRATGRKGLRELPFPTGSQEAIRRINHDRAPDPDMIHTDHAR
jgi:hypothetical protein